MLEEEKLNDYSIIMSIYNKVKPEYLEISLESVFKQTKMTTQFIIIKDGKLTEEQESIVDKYLNKYKDIIEIYEFKENVGSGKAYNKGIELCKNDWAAIMDSDDYILENKFEKQLKFLNENKGIDAIGTNAVEFLGEIDNIVSTRIMPEKHKEIDEFAHMRCPMIQPTVLFSVKKVKECGSYQKSELTEDYDLYIRMIMNGCVFYNYQEVLYYVRTNEDFFKRRGGIKYLSSILKFKYKYYKKDFYNTRQFLKTSIASVIVTLMPNSCRMLFYKKFLRK